MWRGCVRPATAAWPAGRAAVVGAGGCVPGECPPRSGSTSRGRRWPGTFRRRTIDGSAPVRTAKRAGPRRGSYRAGAGRAPRVRGCPAFPRRLPALGPGVGPGGGAAVTDPGAGARGDSSVGSTLDRIRGGTGGPVGRGSRGLTKVLSARELCPQRPSVALNPYHRRVRRVEVNKEKKFFIKGELEK